MKEWTYIQEACLREGKNEGDFVIRQHTPVELSVNDNGDVE